MRIKAIFSTAIAINMVVFVLFGGSILAIEGQEFWSSSNAVDDIGVYGLALKTMEKMSYERGPTNALLGDPLPHDDAKVDRLNAVRMASDQAYQTFWDALKKSNSQNLSVTVAEINAALAKLHSARKQVDTLIVSPLNERPPEAVNAAITSLFEVIDSLSAPVARLGFIAEQSDPEIGGALIVARLAADLREHAGRIGSHLTVPLLAHTPLSKQELAVIFQTRGRIDLYFSILKRRALAFGDDVEATESVKSMEADYINIGLKYVDSVINRGIDTGNYDVTPAGFAARYVPEMSSIVHVRDVFLTQAISRAELHKKKARNTFILVITLALALIGAYIALAQVLRRRILTPLIAATDILIKLVSDGTNHDNTPQKEIDEVHNIIKAVSLLEESHRDKKLLEIERQNLMEQLEQQANTDPLTKLCNRRSFFSFGEREFSQARRRQSNLSVAMIDVDHFKAINDTYGHPAGDRVLIELSQLFIRNCREGDVLGRIGGEEFAVVFVDSPYQQAQEAAERLRLQAENLSIYSGIETPPPSH